MNRMSSYTTIEVFLTVYIQAVALSPARDLTLSCEKARIYRFNCVKAV
jgi:hypothetical protein